jgi:hypothetical protein
MPGFLVHVGAQVLCAHFGQATPTVPNPRVTVSGQPTVLLSAPYVVAGCTFPAITSGAPPCATAQWTTGAVRVTSNSQPLLVQTSQAICAPTGTPLFVLVTQTRVSAT